MLSLLQIINHVGALTIYGLLVGLGVSQSPPVMGVPIETVAARQLYPTSSDIQRSKRSKSSKQQLLQQQRATTGSHRTAPTAPTNSGLSATGSRNSAEPQPSKRVAGGMSSSPRPAARSPRSVGSSGAAIGSIATAASKQGEEPRGRGSQGRQHSG